MKNLKICLLIPTYNNESSIGEVVAIALSYCNDIIVVNDGATDKTPEIIAGFSNNIVAIGYTKNRGKGFALKTGFEEARRRGFRYVITMDSDGQHFANDLPKFVQTITQHPDCLIIGSRSFSNPNMPHGNTFANRFSNFWFTVQTGLKLPDTQTGFRLYPLQKMKKMGSFTHRYEAELELLVRCAWRAIPIIPIDIEVYYPPQNERISHFRPKKDFARISVLNTVLCFVSIFYGYPSMLIHKLFIKS
ncbi:MAG: glycosyltransferase family 2 protein [Bacteroidales bacterium]|nr:glycosyltransferase family 2 protein [Bacteroidales bacterium]